MIIEGETPYIIDFESASQNRTTKNVTTAAQYLFVGSRLSPRIKRIAQHQELRRRFSRRCGDTRDDMSDENYVRFFEDVRGHRLSFKPGIIWTRPTGVVVQLG